MKIYLDGQFVDEAEAKISVFDHGLLYGDGIFEGIRLYQGNVFRLEEHLERLWYSAKAILLNIPISRAEMAAAVCECCRRNGLVDGYIRLVVTRGVGDLGLSPWLCPKPSVFIIADKIALYPPEYYTSGLSIVTVPTRRLGAASLPPMVKSLNYLNNILAKIDARQAGALEAIMLNDAGLCRGMHGRQRVHRPQGPVADARRPAGGAAGNHPRDDFFDRAGPVPGSGGT